MAFARMQPEQTEAILSRWQPLLSSGLGCTEPPAWRCGFLEVTDYQP